MMAEILVLCEHDQGVLVPSTFEALTFARSLASGSDASITALVCGEVDNLDDLNAYGVEAVQVAEHELLADFGPETWGQTLAQLIEESEPALVVGSGTSKGNEVLAQAAAQLDMPFVANCVELDDDGLEDAAVEMTRLQWGGSLLERSTLEADVKLVSVAHHSVEPAPAAAPTTPTVESFEPDLDDELARSVVVAREVAEAGVTLATAPVVVGGGRAMGGPDAFAPLEELAGLLGGRVGCSRAVTNNGWRPHSDQVGQTGTRIAPVLYIASGISGAIQHWVGAAASKNILAINTDPEANMVTKADYAVIGDLHDVIPAVVAEVQQRRTAET